MEIIFIGIILFLFLLAIFDLSVGVSNDAVNFLTSAIGSRAASFRRVVMVASIGVFIGAAMSNGMMDIARHGIFHPEHFSFYEILCIFMAVMVTDILLLDLFNSLGLPTSTTVSMVFELLGATFALSLVKLAADGSLGLGDLLNTDKAFSVILGIFLSVAIAFVFGTVVQFVARLIFTFNYKSRLKWKIGLFGGVASTAIVYFLVIKGMKDLTLMTPEVKAWVGSHTMMLMGGCFVGFTVLMQLLHVCKVNVLKVVVLMGTFALAMAFAGNDLVNFIGVPLTGLASYQDYVAHGEGNPQAFLMGSLNEEAHTPILFLLAAGAIMVVSLATSKKAQRVIHTAVGLGSQNEGEEMFGSSPLARRIVRSFLQIYAAVLRGMPLRMQRWICRRFAVEESVLEEGAAFDLVRGAVNLTLAGMLIALGTSLKLPLSTTYVTFMVAMGSSLADRAWGRESAVFRITGVISVIGGWFITAGVAFIGAAIVVTVMHYGGTWVMVVTAMVAVGVLVRSNLRYRRRVAEEQGDTLFQSMLSTEDKVRVWELLKVYLAEKQTVFLTEAAELYSQVTLGFVHDEVKVLRRCEKRLKEEKDHLKGVRRKETLCFQRIERHVAIEKSTWFYLSNNCCMAMLYSLRRIAEVCAEHAQNNFHPMPEHYLKAFLPLNGAIHALLTEAVGVIGAPKGESTEDLRRRCEEVKHALREESHRVYAVVQSGNSELLSVSYVYLNMLQESQEMMSNLRKLLRASHKMWV